jgi:hypothetical protein
VPVYACLCSESFASCSLCSTVERYDNAIHTSTVDDSSCVLARAAADAIRRTTPNSDKLGFASRLTCALIGMHGNSRFRVWGLGLRVGGGSELDAASRSTGSRPLLVQHVLCSAVPSSSRLRVWVGPTR